LPKGSSRAARATAERERRGVTVEVRRTGQVYGKRAEL
jgi:hypothetical protein